MTSNESDSETVMSIDSEDLYDDSTADADIMEVPQENAAVSWGDLPPLALEKIYSFLNRDHQQSMALVCRSWYNEYASPSLWRKLRFVITAHQYHTQMYPEVHFARKFGRMIHHVEISCEYFRLSLLKAIRRQILLFIQALEFQAQLESVAFINMDFYFNYLDGDMLEDVFQVILSFLLSQHKLEKIEFQNTHFRKTWCAEILWTICITSSQTLKYLLLEGFVEETPEDDSRDNVVDAPLTFNMLLNLKEVEADYSQIFETIVMSCYEYDHDINSKKTTRYLEKMKIFCDGSKSVTYRGILPAAWKQFRKICPSLKINLIFRAESRIKNQLNVFVVRHMPITSLDFRWGKNTDRPEAEIGSLLRYIESCGIISYLEELNIVWLDGSSGLAAELIHFLQVSKKLKTLRLHVQYPVEELDLVFTSWFQNRPAALDDVYITVSNINKTEDMLYYSNLADYYCSPLQQILGLNLLLITNTNV